MEAIHARYPFLAAAREAVETADEELATVASDAPNPIINRALDRITSAIDTGTTGKPHRSTRVELLSYPLARVLVSLVDEPGLTDRYAHAEAATAKDRFTTEIDSTTDLRSIDHTPLTLDDLLAEFDLTNVVSATADGYTIEVTHFLRLTGGLDTPEWRLGSRALADGVVPVTRDELFALLGEAIRTRVRDGLPLDVPPAIASELDPVVDTIRDRLADFTITTDFDTVSPALFPPCIDALLDRLESTAPLPDHSEFALVSFLVWIGMPTDDIVETLSQHPAIDADAVRYKIARLRDESETALYPPPSCQTMQANDDCVNMDALCEQITHPLTYYARRLDNDDTVLTADP